MKILNSEQMRNIDRRASDEFGIPSLLLMENAAMACAEVFAEHFAEARRVAIFCGTGNNGGDGFALARHLLNRGLMISLFLLGDAKKIKGDAKTNFEICEKSGVPIEKIDSDQDLRAALETAARSDVVVDAIFGTGLDRAPEGIYADAVAGICELNRPVLAVDLPSGLNASTPQVPGPAVIASVTVSFAAPKVAHVFEPAASHCGEVVIADISIPDEAIEAEGVTLSLITPSFVSGIVAPRAADTHKGTYGHVAILAGSEGKSGAAVLCARGAIRAGAGLVTVMTDAKTARIVDSASIESMSFAFDRREGLDAIRGFLEDKDVLLIGPGLPDDKNSYAFIRELLELAELPIVADAGAVNAFKGKASSINLKRRPMVLTPHPGELSRLMGISTEKIAADRIGAARDAAQSTGAVVLLKGHQTLIASPESEVRVNPTGNPGMASGGMGDVLAGMVAALMAQGVEPFDAASAAAYLHGFAGDLLQGESADLGLAALDLADAIPRAVAAIREMS